MPRAQESGEEEPSRSQENGISPPTWSQLDVCFENEMDPVDIRTPLQKSHEYAGNQDMAKEKGRVSQEGETSIGPRPCFITGLFQDQDLQEERIGKEGSLTFSHSLEGDIELQENTGETTIPARYPPMSATTVDWSVKYMPENLWRGGHPSCWEQDSQARDLKEIIIHVLAFGLCQR